MRFRVQGVLAGTLESVTLLFEGWEVATDLSLCGSVDIPKEGLELSREACSAAEHARQREVEHMHLDVVAVFGILGLLKDLRCARAVESC